MRKAMAAAGSSLFFLAAPVCVAGAVPYWLSAWRLQRPLEYLWPLRCAGAALLLASATVLVPAFARFVSEGSGTPAPIAPTERLVVGGAYRYLRNPMYVAVVAAITGQALIFWQPRLLVYAALVLALMIAFVRGYEEPTLRRKYGTLYEQYRQAVPGWWPRRPAGNRARRPRSRRSGS